MTDEDIHQVVDQLEAMPLGVQEELARREGHLAAWRDTGSVEPIARSMLEQDTVGDILDMTADMELEHEKAKACSACGGSGGGRPPHICPSCGGSGRA